MIDFTVTLILVWFFDDFREKNKSYDFIVSFRPENTRFFFRFLVDFQELSPYWAVNVGVNFIPDIWNLHLYSLFKISYYFFTFLLFSSNSTPFLHFFFSRFPKSRPISLHFTPFHDMRNSSTILSCIFPEYLETSYYFSFFLNVPYYFQRYIQIPSFVSQPGMRLPFWHCLKNCLIYCVILLNLRILAMKKNLDWCEYWRALQMVK